MTIGNGVDFDTMSLELSGKELLDKRQAMDRVRKDIGSLPDDEKELREACEGFEAIFIAKLWKQMRDTVPKDGYLHGKQEEAYLSMFDQAFAEEMTSAGGIGLADMLYQQLQQQKETASLYTSPSEARNRPPLAPLRPELVETLPPEGEEEESFYSSLEGEYSTNSLYEPVEGVEDTGAVSPGVDLGQGTGDLDQYGREEDPVEEADEISGEPPKQEPERISLMGRINELASRIESRVGAEPQLAPGVDSLLTAVGTMAVGNDGPMPSVEWPSNGEVSSHFGWRIDPFTGKRAFHSGVDLAGQEGDPVTACWDGRVIFAGERGNYGQMVVVEHANGWRSYYGHNSRNLVRAGDVVKAGQEIAEMGTSGRSTGPHLHFELRQGELAWDPEQIQERLLAGLTIGR